jgi:hypothetical protein
VHAKMVVKQLHIMLAFVWTLGGHGELADISLLVQVSMGCVWTLCRRTKDRVSATDIVGLRLI